MILGASFDSVEDNRAFAEKFSYQYKLLCDTGKITAALYGVADEKDPGRWPARLSFLIGPDRRVKKVYEVKDTAGHAAQVLSDLP